MSLFVPRSLASPCAALLRRAAGVAAVVALIPSPSLFAADGGGGGWTSPLWHANGSAKTALRKTIAAASPAAPSGLAARRQLGLIAWMQDDDAGCVADWRWALMHRPDDPVTAACWPEFVNEAETIGREDDLTVVARALSADRNAQPALRASAQQTIARTAYRLGRTADAERAWDALGYVRRWQIVGPFENVSRSGLDRAFDPERRIALGAPCSGAEDRSIRWHPAVLVGRDGMVRLSDSLSDGDEDVYYAVTAVNAPRGGRTVLRFDTAGASEVFVNGRAVSRDPVYRQEVTGLADQYAVPVTLQPGWNTILVKIADDQAIAGAFRLRLTDASGNTVYRYAADPGRAAPAGVAAGAEAAGLAAPQPALVAALLAHRQASPDDAEAVYWLGMRQRESGDDEAAIATLRAALARDPDSAYLHWELSQALADNQLADDARAERSLALQKDGTIVAAALDAEDDRSDSLPATEQIQRLKSLLARANPNSGSLLIRLADAYQEAGMTGDALRVGRRAAAVNSGEFGQIALYHLYQQLQRNGEANAVVQAALRRYPNSAALLESLASRLADNGDSAAIGVYRRLVAAGTRPDPNNYRTLAALLAAAQNRRAAVTVLEQARAARPQDAALCAQLADLQRDLGNKPAAIALYREAIQLDPSQVDLRDKLQALSGATPALSLAPATDTHALLAHLPKAADLPGVSEVRVLDEGRQVVYPDYASALHNHEIITVLDDAAVQKYQRFPVHGDSASSSSTVEVCRIIKADGKIVDCQDQVQDGIARFPSLAPGDTIDVAYRTEDYPQHGLAGKFWSNWYFSDGAGPVRLSRYVLVAPRTMDVTVRSHGGVADPTVRDSGPWRIREWRDANQPDAKPEPLAPAQEDNAPWVDISSIHSWKDIVAWYRTLSGPRCEPDAAIRAKAEELTRGLTTDREKMRAIVAYVAHKIQYQTTPFRMSAFIPTEGKIVLRDNYGDCKDKAALISAMFQCVGIKSHMALLSPREFGTTPYLPSPRFAHAILVADTADGPLWIDGTADYLAFGDLPEQDQGVPALVIDDATTDLTQTPVLPVDRNELTENVRATLDAEGNLSATHDLSFTGDLGWLLREALHSVPESSRDQALIAMGGRLLSAPQIKSATVENLDSPEKPLVLHYTYTSPGFAQASGTLLLAKLPWAEADMADSSEQVIRAGAATRKSDMEVPLGRSRAISHVQLTLPPGYTLKEVPPVRSAETPYGSYRLTCALNGNVFTADREQSTLLMRIPAKEIAGYLDFGDGLRKQMKTPLVLEQQAGH